MTSQETMTTNQILMSLMGDVLEILLIAFISIGSLVAMQVWANNNALSVENAVYQLDSCGKDILRIVTKNPHIQYNIIPTVKGICDGKNAAELTEIEKAEILKALK
jgi:hypothetical protein